MTTIEVRDVPVRIEGRIAGNLRAVHVRSNVAEDELILELVDARGSKMKLSMPRMLARALGDLLGAVNRRDMERHGDLE